MISSFYDNEMAFCIRERESQDLDWLTKWGKNVQDYMFKVVDHISHNDWCWVSAIFIGEY